MQGRIENPRMPDLLSDQLSMFCEISEEAYRNFSRMVPKDREERRILAGTLEVKGKSARISIQAVLEDVPIRDEEIEGTIPYSSGIGGLTYDPGEVRDAATENILTEPKLKGMRFLGVIIAYPDGRPNPTSEDLKAMIAAYQLGDIKFHDPFIIGVSAVIGKDTGELRFYRVVRTKSKSGFGFKLLERSKR